MVYKFHVSPDELLAIMTAIREAAEQRKRDNVSEVDQFSLLSAGLLERCELLLEVMNRKHAVEEAQRRYVQSLNGATDLPPI